MMTENNPVPRWAVTHQLQRTKAEPNGSISEGYDVSFTTRGGHTGTVFVPAARYTVDGVSAAVDAEATKLDAVGQLTSSD